MEERLERVKDEKERLIERELDKLYKKIQSQRNKLIFPILILSQEEATKIILGKTNIGERYIYPSIWQENIDKKRFQIWKEELSLSAREIVEERKTRKKIGMID